MKIAIIGTRNLKNPKQVLQNIVKYLKDNKIKVRLVVSGNAVGTDQLANHFAKVEGVTVAHYLPWPSFNKQLVQNKPNIRYFYNPTKIFDNHILTLFPHMSNVSKGVWSLIRRNYQIILGLNGTNPCDIVFWHTTDGNVHGGTAYGVKLAEEKGIKLVRV